MVLSDPITPEDGREHAALGWLVDLLGADDPRVTRLRDLLKRKPRPEPRFTT
jgi:hypothetical protein